MSEPKLSPVDSACMYFRHDYGLMDEEGQAQLRRDAEEWRYAFQKVEEDNQPNAEHCRRCAGTGFVPSGRSAMEGLVLGVLAAVIVTIVFATGWAARGLL